MLETEWSCLQEEEVDRVIVFWRKRREKIVWRKRRGGQSSEGIPLHTSAVPAHPRPPPPSERVSLPPLSLHSTVGGGPPPPAPV